MESEKNTDPKKGISNNVSDKSLPIILGSSSKWRKKIIAEIFEDSIENILTISPNIDEKAIRDPDPKLLTLKIAQAKCDAICSKIKYASIVVCCDQVIVCDGKVREKPETKEQALEYLESYRNGHPAEAVVAVVVRNTLTGKTISDVVTAKQYFSYFPDELINELIDEGEIFNCAGGFTVEKMDLYCKELEGDITTIMGLPRSATIELISKAK